jgi:hypothetical protein
LKPTILAVRAPEPVYDFMRSSAFAIISPCRRCEDNMVQVEQGQMRPIALIRVGVEGFRI